MPFRLAASLIFEAGARARQAFEQHYDRPIAAARIVKILGLEPTEAPARIPDSQTNPYAAVGTISDRQETAAAS